MTAILSSKERDKAVLALRDIQGILEYTRNPGFDALDEVQTILASRGLRIVSTTPPAAPLVPQEPAPPIAAPNAASVPAGISTNDLYWLETTIIGMYRANKLQNRTGYVLKNESLGKLLHILCRPLRIPFKL